MVTLPVTTPVLVALYLPRTTSFENSDAVTNCLAAKPVPTKVSAPPAGSVVRLRVRCGGGGGYCAWAVCAPTSGAATSTAADAADARATRHPGDVVIFFCTLLDFSPGQAAASAVSKIWVPTSRYME
jgi:hypothetical protein